MSESQEQPLNAVVDLEAACDEMRREASGSVAGHVSRTLLHEPDLRVVLVVMASGGRIKEHQAHSATSIHVLRGAVEVGLPEQAASVAAGRLLTLGGGVAHSVTANKESAFLLTLGRPA